MGFSNMMIAAAKSMPKSTITQSIPSFTYSSCSTTNMWWLKNCWSFSLTKLIEICSKPLYSKISNPAMSNTAQKFAFLECCINKSVITLLNQPFENTVEDCTSNTSSGLSGLLNSLSFGDPLSSNLDSWFAESFYHSSGINTECSSSFASKMVKSNIRQLSLIITTFLDILNTTAGHNTCSQDIAIKLFPFFKSKDIEGIFCILKLFVIVNGSYGCFTLRDVDVVIDIRADKAFSTESTITNSITIWLEELVEDMV